MESFPELPASEWRGILSTLSSRTGFSPAVLEKDVWICWTLDKVFRIEQLHGQMVLKGGTSLSKAYRLINRFSEDLDLTIDYRWLLDGEDPDLSTLSRNARDVLSRKLRRKLTRTLSSVVVPSLENSMQDLGVESGIRLLPDGENVLVQYPSVLEPRDGYLKEEIRLEFGGRNVAVPCLEFTIQPEIALEVSSLLLPSASISVLAAQRTFWEKATLIHVECNRGFKSTAAERKSRHWYDLVMLGQSIEGREALSDRPLLMDVIRVKKAFFNSASARYDDCNDGRLHLVPGESDTALLRSDYVQMRRSGMFTGDPPEFEELISECSRLQDAINSGKDE